jgi:hypothetical protein
MNSAKEASKLPILIIGYSRVLGIKGLLSSIDPVEVKSVHLAIDGKKSLDLEIIQIEIINLVSQFCTDNDIPFRLWAREENLGVAVSIITALDWFFSEVPFGVVLEDDLLVGRDFFEFSRFGLEMMEAHPDILLASGDFFLKSSFSKSSAFLTNYPLIWGWTTNSKNWAQIRSGILSKRRLVSLISLNKKNNYWRVGAFRVLRGKIDTWDIPFADFMNSEKKYCLFPSKNLISNVGNDAFASHTSKQEFPLNLAISPWGLKSKIEFGDLLLECKLVNSVLDETVYKIGVRHSFLGVLYMLRCILGLENGPLENLRSRVKKTPVPKII